MLRNTLKRTEYTLYDPNYVYTPISVITFEQLSGAAQGLDYLHQCNIIHGNSGYFLDCRRGLLLSIYNLVRCVRIYTSLFVAVMTIDVSRPTFLCSQRYVSTFNQDSDDLEVCNKGEACICDFGMSKVIEDVTDKSASATLTAIEGSARWLAPELIEGSTPSPTKASDVYSFAMAMLELVTTKRPYSDRKRDASVIHDIMVKRRTPPFPGDAEARQWLQAGMWRLMEDCWNSSPDLRPEMHNVAERMMDVEKKFGRSSVSSVISEIIPADELSFSR
jgi:serine/threonine protein kinase